MNLRLYAPLRSLCVCSEVWCGVLWSAFVCFGWPLAKPPELISIKLSSRLIVFWRFSQKWVIFIFFYFTHTHTQNLHINENDLTWTHFHVIWSGRKRRRVEKEKPCCLVIGRLTFVPSPSCAQWGCFTMETEPFVCVRVYQRMELVSSVCEGVCVWVKQTETTALIRHIKHQWFTARLF